MRLEVIDIIRDVVNDIPSVCSADIQNINFIFGSARYVKDRLDLYAQSVHTTDCKFPLIALFTPVDEVRGTKEHYSEANISLVIACSSSKEYSNEERETESFVNVLRPIYRAMMNLLYQDGRLDTGYTPIKHNYSENYDYGRYGAYTADGEEVSEPIDAINIRSLELNINYPNCR